MDKSAYPTDSRSRNDQHGKKQYIYPSDIYIDHKADQDPGHELDPYQNLQPKFFFLPFFHYFFQIIKDSQEEKGKGIIGKQTISFCDSKFPKTTVCLFDDDCTKVFCIIPKIRKRNLARTHTYQFWYRKKRSRYFVYKSIVHKKKQQQRERQRP